MNLDKLFEEKVYAGVLGKIIGVYLGRPFEGWDHKRIMDELGPINYYVNDKLNKPLCVTDDDITGTFAFLRALKDFNYDKNITAKQIGQTWLNNLIEDRTILWWGGKGHSAEDTAYQNLKQGIHAPDSGSIKVNGKVIAEQIGAQIFIDGWALVSPGDPEQAVSLAGKAASVSHDGEAVYGAQIIAAIESMAFIENDIKKIIEQSKKFVPSNSVIYKLISDIQNWSLSNIDWLQAREKIVEKYGYDKYLGNCHMVPNHALIIMSLLFGDDDLQKTLMIVNTSGWDTDCNSGNVGCILGIKNGLAGLKSGPDYISPINDIIYCPTAVGGETITDALTESYKIINSARKINKLDKKNMSKNEKCECLVDTFFPEHLTKLEGVARKTFFHYDLISTPIVNSGQKIVSEIISDVDQNITVTMFIKYWGKNDELFIVESEKYNFSKVDRQTNEWVVPDTNSNPIGQLGISIASKDGVSGKVSINYVDIKGDVKMIFSKPGHIIQHPRKYTMEVEENFYGQMWRNAWVKGLDKWEDRGKNFRISNNIGKGVLFTGNNVWKNYSVSSPILLQSVSSGGLVARVQGLKRYYTLELCSSNKIRIGKMFYDFSILDEVDFNVDFFKNYQLTMKVNGNIIKGFINNDLLIEYEDKENILEDGGAGLTVSDGTLVADEIAISN